MTSRLFSLITDQTNLSMGNRGIGQMHYVQYAPSRDVTGNNFPQGAQYIKWDVAGTKWWVPRRSYLRMRARLRKQTGAATFEPLNYSDNIAPNQSLFANLFQSCEFRIQQQTISRVSDYVAQIDSLDKRLTQSKSWLDSTGGTANFYQADFRDRQNEAISNGISKDNINFIRDSINNGGGDDGLGDNLDFLDLATPNQVEFIVANNQVVFTANGGTAIPDLSRYFSIGDYIAFDDGAEKVQPIIAFITTNTTNDTLSLGGPAITAVPAANLFAQVRIQRPILDIDSSQSRRVDGFELIWQPPLSIFKVNHAMPAGKYELVLNPQNSNIYQKLAIESLLTDKVAGLGNDFVFEVVDMYLYIAQIEGPRVENLSYYLDLEEITCQKRAIQASTGLQQEEFSVSPSTCALTLAFQDSRTGSNSLYSPARYKIGGVANSELELVRMYINYAGINKPQPDADPNYKIGTAEDYTVQRWADSTIYSGTYFTQGGAESISDWHKRGAYYHLPWPKDSTDRSTRVFTNYQFNSNVANGTVLLFNHYKKAALIKIENGNATQVMVQEM